MEAPILTDSVVTLRQWDMADALHVHEMVQDPEIPRFMEIPLSQTAEGVRRWLSGRAEGWESGVDMTFAVEATRGGRLLGSVGLERSMDDAAIAEIGYWIGSHERQRGFAKRAVMLVAEWAFAEAGIERLEITTHRDNEASQRVAATCGFMREGVLRSYREHHGQRVDLVMFSRLRCDEL
ncbi:MAG TPA: GNAT family N-acetyltransferase [Coriobacteriia bacterium]|nr:GNAT family N-acetyltransferase [Coriobacteriia bacterium]